MKNEQTKIMKKKSFVYGAIILGLSSIICKILGAIFRLPLTNLIGANGIGIYQLVFPIFALFLVVSSSGIPVALSKIISKEYSKQNYKNIKIIEWRRFLHHMVHPHVLLCKHPLLFDPGLLPLME